jgi:signal transduction histidine kinase/CheY-like chemotaxis protein
MVRTIMTTPIKQESDLVTVRGRAKRISELLGFDVREQTRLAAAVSEIARNTILFASGGVAEFLVSGEPPNTFLIRIRDNGAGIVGLQELLDQRASLDAGQVSGIVSARRLVEHFEIRSTPGGTIVDLGKSLPSGSAAPSPARISEINEQLRRERSDDPMAALREQSEELLSSLNDLRDRQEELIRLNRELEDTNRGVVALYAELDERAEQLRHASQLKSRFLSNMSHEFRTPLASILALSGLLLDGADGVLLDEQQRQVRYIRQSAESLIEMVNDLLDLAKVEAGRIDVDPVKFRAAELFAGLRGALKPLLTSDVVDLVFEDVEELPPFWTDEAKVAQILRNFISNALKFTVRGEVRVGARFDPDSDMVVFSVRDTGIGIHASDLPRVFEEFTQVESEMQHRNKGTGLGLPLSRKLAELLGGDVSVESSPGVGSSFFLSVPLRYDRAAALAENAPLGEPKHVLLVDDDESFRKMMKQAFAAVPRMRVEEASDGREALARIAGDKPDLVVLDLNMPVLDGFAVFDALARDAATRDIPIVVSTSTPIDAALRFRLERAALLLPKQGLSQRGMLKAVRRALTEQRR